MSTDPVAGADVAANLDAALLERMWALFDVALEVVQRPEEPFGEPSAEQWSRLHRALAAVPECQRDKPLQSAAEIARLRAERERYQAMVLRASEAIETIGRRENDLRAEVEAYRAAGELAHKDIDQLEAANAALRAEVAELRTSVVAFGGPWAAVYARDHGAPDGALHHRHYDILAAAGARMADFARWVPDDERL